MYFLVITAISALHLKRPLPIAACQSLPSKFIEYRELITYCTGRDVFHIQPHCETFLFQVVLQAGDEMLDLLLSAIAEKDFLRRHLYNLMGVVG